MQPETIDVAEFGAQPDQGSDSTPAIASALAACRARGIGRLVFSTGRYHFWPDRAPERYVFISNNDEGLRRIAFLLEGLRDLVIDGQGAEFVFHDMIIPFAIENSQGVTLKNFSIDWDKTFHCEGIVISSDENGAELEIPEQFPYRVVNGRFESLGANREGWVLRNMLEWDAQRRETAFGAQDNYGAGDKLRVEESGPRRVRFIGAFSEPRPTVGNIMLLADSGRTCPAVFITESSEVALEDVSIFHAGAMGVIAQRSTNLSLQRVKVMPGPGSGRMISATADATHFVSCRGRIELIDCVFETQVDDASNVHGIYTRITGRPDACSVEVRLMHGQQLGKNPAEIGHLMQFINRDTLAPTHEAEVMAVRRINKEFTVLTFAEPLPESIREGDAVLDLYWQPTETILRRCTLSGNRARGFLVSVSGRVLIEDCTFHVPGAAVLIEGDANYWFESGAVSDVTIRNNSFTHCNYGPWGEAAIQISPGIKPPIRRAPHYHRNIRIENNRFEVFLPTLVDAYSVDGLIFKNNEVIRSGVYPAKHSHAQSFHLRDCANVEVEEHPSVCLASA